MTICCLLADGHIYREGVSEVVARGVLRRMRALYPRLTWWLEVTLG